MNRLTKRYEDGSHGVADDLPCGENSYAFRDMLVDKLGRFEDTGLTPEEIMDGKLLTGWIPVEEQMPKPREKVLITTSDGEVDTDSWNSEEGWFWAESAEDYKIIAWMPLPESYKEYL